MKILKILLLPLLLSVLTACSVTYPHTVPEFRSAEKGVKRDSFSSPLSYQRIQSIYQRKFDECFQVQITHTSAGSKIVETLKPKYAFGKTRGSAYLQLKTTYSGSLVIGAGKAPEEGRFIVLVDIIPKAKGSTLKLVRIDDMTSETTMAKKSSKIIESWSKGEKLNACPNL